MITRETTQVFIAGVSAKSQPIQVLDLMTDFCMKEPHVVAYISVIMGSEAFKNPVTAALAALATYEKMRVSQEEADRLKRETR